MVNPARRAVYAVYNATCRLLNRSTSLFLAYMQINAISKCARREWQRNVLLTRVSAEKKGKTWQKKNRKIWQILGEKSDHNDHINKVAPDAALTVFEESTC